MRILKSKVQEEVAKGGKTKEIAERLGIKLPELIKAAKHFNINLREKPLKVIEFIDDTNQVVTSITFTSETIDEEGNVEDSDSILYHTLSPVEISLLPEVMDSILEEKW